MGALYSSYHVPDIGTLFPIQIHYLGGVIHPKDSRWTAQLDHRGPLTTRGSRRSWGIQKCISRIHRWTVGGGPTSLWSGILDTGGAWVACAHLSIRRKQNRSQSQIKAAVRAVMDRAYSACLGESIKVKLGQ